MACMEGTLTYVCLAPRQLAGCRIGGSIGPAEPTVEVLEKKAKRKRKIDAIGHRISPMGPHVGDGLVDRQVPSGDRRGLRREECTTAARKLESKAWCG